MSYILDALRRLEQDKERAKRGANPMEAVLVPEMEEAGEPQRRRLWWVGIGVVLLVTVILATYWVTRRTLGDHPKLAKQETAPPLPSVVPGYDRSTLSSSPEATSPSIPSRGSDRERVPPSSAPSRPGPTPSPPPLREPAAVPDTSPPIRGEEGRQSVASAEERMAPARQERTTPSRDDLEDEVFQEWRESEIKINAIAYSRDDKSRFAVVNLKTVHEGDEFEGLAVVAIQENGIVFEREGTKYRVLLGKR